MQLIHSNHSVSGLQYHFVFSPKYREPLLIANVEKRLGKIIQELADEKGWVVQSLEIMPDHVHLLLAAEPKWSASEIMKFIKGRSSFLLRKEFPILKEIVQKSLWTHSFFVCSVGDTNEDVVKRYIENQKKEMV